MPYSFVITSCPGTNPGSESVPADIVWPLTLWEGSYRLQVWYPGALEDAATLDVRLVSPSS
jgi:hypothetical protein